jgi:threonine aldolase
MMIDLRSDTVTRPTPEMREAMFNAQVGDDVFGEDPTVNVLQEKIAQLTGKEAALFVASGTMGNQVSINAHTQPGNEIIMEGNSHIFNYECGSPALLSGVQIMPLPGLRGSFTVEKVEEVIRPDNVHHPKTALICIENTHNRAGGTIFPYENIQQISTFAREHSLKMHLDGARLWNASIATGIPISEYARHFDSISLCFSKGLGAPVGSIIAGSREFINRARYYRKVYGGGMRQAGILAAAAIYAVDHHFQRLVEDHRRAKMLGEFIATLPEVEFDKETVQTNIIIFDIRTLGIDGQKFVDLLASEGVKMITFAKTKIRAVTNLHISDADIEQTILALKKIFDIIEKHAIPDYKS